MLQKPQKRQNAPSKKFQNQLEADPSEMTLARRGLGLGGKKKKKFAYSATLINRSVAPKPPLELGDVPDASEHSR